MILETSTRIPWADLLK